jgi:voltage-gated potassium channel
MVSPQREFRLNLVYFFLLTLAVIFLGTLAFVLIEGWGVLDALYMTFITITTVGFGEVHPLSDHGKILTIVVLIAGVITISLWVGEITRFAVERQIGTTFRRRKMLNQIKKLKNHVIICGAGEAGRVIIREFLRSREKFVVIEKDPEVVHQLREMFPDLLLIEGDATKDEVLQEANIEQARGIISTLSADADNLFVTISAKTLNPGIQVVSRAIDSDTISKLYQVGADHVISPKITEGLRMASVMLRPSVVSFLEVVTLGEDIDLYLEEVTIEKGAKLSGVTLAQAQIPQKIGLIVIAVKKSDGSFTYNPKSDTLLEAGDVLIVLGKPFQVDRLRQYIRTGKAE